MPHHQRIPAFQQLQIIPVAPSDGRRELNARAADNLGDTPTVIYPTVAHTLQSRLHIQCYRTAISKFRFASRA